MKKQKLHPAFLWVLIPAFVLLFIMMFIQPTLQLEMGQLFRPQDEPCTLWDFQVVIRDNVLVQGNYTVKTGEDAYTAVISVEGSNQPEVQEYTAVGSQISSALTLSQAKSLIEPVCQTMLDEMRGADLVGIRLIPSKEAKPALTDMTISVSSGKIAPATESYAAVTDYGMLEANVSDKDMTVMLTKYIMLIP